MLHLSPFEDLPQETKENIYKFLDTSALRALENTSSACRESIRGYYNYKRKRFSAALQRSSECETEVKNKFRSANNTYTLYRLNKTAEEKKIVCHLCEAAAEGHLSLSDQFFLLYFIARMSDAINKAWYGTRVKQDPTFAPLRTIYFLERHTELACILMANISSSAFVGFTSCLMGSFKYRMCDIYRFVKRHDRADILAEYKRATEGDPSWDPYIISFLVLLFVAIACKFVHHSLFLFGIIAY